MARDIELLNSPENILYSTDDFPTVKMVSSKHFEIDWDPKRRTDLVDRFREGIFLTSENAKDFINEFLEIRNRFGCPKAELRWLNTLDFHPLIGWHSLTRIITFPEEVEQYDYMDMFSFNGAYKDTALEVRDLKPSNKMMAHNIENPNTAIFYIETIAHYLRYAGISFPHISTEANDKGDLFYSFEIPFTPKSQERYELACLTEPLLYDNLSVYTEQKKDGRCVWVANDLPDPLVAIKLFNSLSAPLKQEETI